MGICCEGSLIRLMNSRQYSSRKRVLFAILRIAKTLGMFSLARVLTQNNLRILTYHGAQIDDESSFRGGLFISKNVFKRRMGFLKRQKYPVLKLNEALQLLAKGNLPAGATVITIDDGWWGTYSVMAPVLEQHQFPSTLYVSTYYMQNQVQVFNVAVDYVLWRSVSQSLNLHHIAEGLNGVYELQDPAQRAQATDALCRYADSLGSAGERQQLLQRVGAQTGVDVTELEKRRILSYMTAEEARELGERGMDIQLHTHRHCLPTNHFSATEKEIEDNRQALQSVASSRLEHFCYPSGEYEAHQLEWLEALGVKSATTVKNGFNTVRTNHLELRRFLDWEQITDIEFEAEVSGFFELVRRCGYSI